MHALQVLECNKHAVLPGVDVRRHALSLLWISPESPSVPTVIKLNSPNCLYTIIGDKGESARERIVVLHFSPTTRPSSRLTSMRKTTNSESRVLREGIPCQGCESPPNILPTPQSCGRRCGATAQSALGWYRPSVGVPETLDGNCTQRCTCLTIFSSVQLPSNVSNGEVGPQG